MTTKLVNGVRVEMTPEEVFDLQASRAPSKEQAKNQKISEVKAKTAERIAAGAPYGGSRYPVDGQGQLAVIAVSTSLANNRGLPQGKSTQTVRDIQRNKSNLTASEYLDYAVALRDYVAAVNEAAEGHVDQVLALYADATKTASDISNYDPSTGWPA